MKKQNVKKQTSSTTDEFTQFQSQFQYTPVPIRIEPERIVLFNEVLAKCIFYSLVSISWFAWLVKGGYTAGTHESKALVLTAVAFEFCVLCDESNILYFLNSFSRTKVLTRWSIITFFSFVLLGYDIYTAWEVKTHPVRYGIKMFPDSVEILYVIFICLAIYRVIVCLVFVMFLVHGVYVYKENERMRREDEATP